MTTCPECDVPGCGRTDTRLYARGRRCPDHGWPDPPGRYCAPLRCYCGGCPSWRPDTAHAIAPTVFDERAIASGQRRSSPAGYRAAQAAVAARRSQLATERR